MSAPDQPGGLGPGEQELLDGLTSLVAVVDADGRIVAANAAWRAVARLGAVDDPLGLTYPDLCANVPGCGMEPACAAIDELETTEIESIEYTSYEEEYVPWAAAGGGLLALGALLGGTWLRRTP